MGKGLRTSEHVVVHQIRRGLWTVQDRAMPGFRLNPPNTDTSPEPELEPEVATPATGHP